MTQGEIKSLVREEVERMFGGHEGVVFAPGSDKTQHARNGYFFDRFLEAMSGIHRAIATLAERVASVEHQLHDLEQVVRQNGHKQPAPKQANPKHEGNRPQ